MEGDRRPAFKLLLSCSTGLSASQVTVVFDESYDRVPHPDVDLENSIAEIWDQRLKQNASLYNATKFRYGGHIWNSETAPEKLSQAYLLLGLTDYRTFIGTNLSPFWEKFLVPSEDEQIRCRHSSNPLGNGAVVETSDLKILVLKRSNNVGEFPGHFVFPGGHPEPQEVGIISNKKNFADAESVNRKVAQEMFDSIVREVVEEIGVPVKSLSDPVFIGISQRELNVRPTAFFFIKCILDSKSIEELYHSAQDGFESTQLIAVSQDELENMAHMMPGCHEGGYALYKLMVEAWADA